MTVLLVKSPIRHVLPSQSTPLTEVFGANYLASWMRSMLLMPLTQAFKRST